MFKYLSIIFFGLTVMFANPIDKYIEEAFIPEETGDILALLDTEEAANYFLTQFVHNNDLSDTDINNKVREAYSKAIENYPDLALSKLNYATSVLLNLYYTKLSVYFGVPKDKLIASINSNKAYYSELMKYAVTVLKDPMSINPNCDNVIDIVTMIRKVENGF